MNDLRSMSIITSDPEEAGRQAVLLRFRVEDIQHLGRSDLLLAQSLAGHGDVWGRWKTSTFLAPGSMGNYVRDIDLGQRLRDKLLNEPAIEKSTGELIDDGVLLLTRLALVTRLIGSGGRGHSRTMRLKPSSIAQQLYRDWPKIIARAIRRRAARSNKGGLLACLTEDDILGFNAYKPTRIQVSRLDTLVSRGVWTDAPPLPNILLTTDPSGMLSPRPPENKAVPFPPIPDSFMASIGPRALWIVEKMGPQLLHILEVLQGHFKNFDWSLSTAALSRRIQRCIADYMLEYGWKDDAGKPLMPPFSLTTAMSRGHVVDTCEWPPRNWEHIVTLSVTLQAAHLFITLLACAGRVGEVETLQRDCIRVERDGNNYLRGFTYKLSGILFGDERPWPAPDILRHCLGQQSRLAALWDWLPESFYVDELPQTPRYGSALWISLGVTGNARKEGARLNITNALMFFAERVSLDPAPGGKNLHPHRFRKTVGRLAGVALFNSPLVLKRLFGHKTIEMTLHYILCDPGIREEAEKVLRELRIMHCSEALEEIHLALQNGQSLPANGGPGAARLVSAVTSEMKRIEASGRVWADGSAYDLAYLLTAQGQGWRLIKENIICSKAPGEDGICQKQRTKGEPNTANCQPECINRIVLGTQRRDTELVIEQYLDIARQARDDCQWLVLAGVMENLREELESFAELKERYLADPDVQLLFELCGQPIRVDDVEEVK